MTVNEPPTLEKLWQARVFAGSHEELKSADAIRTTFNEL